MSSGAVRRRYAVVLGEALVDLLETDFSGAGRAFRGAAEDSGAAALGYRPAIGGAPLNVAVGLARLGGAVEFAGSVSADVWGERIRAFLRSAGVGERGVVTVEEQSALALTTFDGPEPSFTFYGSPPSYGLFEPADLDPTLVGAAAAVYAGSIALLCPPALAAARRAWAIAGPAKTFDPNVRPALLRDPAGLRAVVEEFAAGADLVKLSAADALALYADTPRAVADRLVDVGAGAVVMTLGGDGALVVHGGQRAVVAGLPVRAVDATGAGDAAMAGLLFGILTQGLPADLGGWVALTGTAMRVAAVVCEAPGGATAMPTLEQVRRRFPSTLANRTPAERPDRGGSGRGGSEWGGSGRGRSDRAGPDRFRADWPPR